MRLVLGCLLLALPALAQLDSAAMRAKFGTPLNRETFRVRPGFEIVVDYGDNHQVCRLEIPAATWSPAETQRIFEELVPESMRGKGFTRTGYAGQYVYTNPTTDYEYFRIDWGNSIDVQFKSVACKP
jgi:hypothetical protein